MEEAEEVLVMVHRGEGGGEGVREVAIVVRQRVVGRVAGKEKGERGRAGVELELKAKGGRAMVLVLGQRVWVGWD